MRQLVFVLIALLAVVTFIRAYDVPANQGNQLRNDTEIILLNP